MNLFLETHYRTCPMKLNGTRSKQINKQDNVTKKHFRSTHSRIEAQENRRNNHFRVQYTQILYYDNMSSFRIQRILHTQEEPVSSFRSIPPRTVRREGIQKLIEIMKYYLKKTRNKKERNSHTSWYVLTFVRIYLIRIIIISNLPNIFIRNRTIKRSRNCLTISLSLALHRTHSFTRNFKVGILMLNK